jgi:hypothetical protein
MVALTATRLEAEMVATRALLGIALAGVLLAAPGAGASADVPTVSGVVAMDGAVDVSSLPPFVDEGQAQPALPQQLPDPQAYAAAKSASRTAAPAPAAHGARRGSAPSISAGMVLPSPLASPNQSIRPPDMGLAAGGGMVVEMVNQSGEMWNASGMVVKTFALSDFFNSGSDRISDPWVVFDRAAGRFYAIILDVTRGGERLAVSQTADPSKRWKRFFVPEGGGCPDQGKLGFDDVVIAISANRFTTCPGGSWLGDVITVIAKAPLLSGSLASFERIGPDPSRSSEVPAESSSSTPVLMFAATDSTAATADTLHLKEEVGIPPAPVQFAQEDISVPLYGIPPAATEPDLHQLDTGDSRVQDVIWRNGELVYAITTGCTPRGDFRVESCALVTAINTSNDTRMWTRWFSRAQFSTYFPAITFSGPGDIAVSMGRTGPGIDPELIGTAGTAGGSFAKAVRIQSGNDVNDTDRFGDYYAASADSTNPANVWLAGEIGGHNPFGALGWGTAVGLLHIG